MSVIPDYIQKFHRANHHLADLDNRLVNWFNSGSHTAWFEPNPNRPKELLVKASTDELPVDPFSLIIGDVVQNYRSCLDHVALALANAHTKPLPEAMAGDSQFPIIGDVNRKGDAGQGLAMFEAQRRRIIGASPAAQAVIQRYQPYHRGNDYKLDPLWILGELSNIDKHRTLHLATVYTHGWTFSPGRLVRFPILKFQGAMPINFSTTGASVKRDTVIGQMEIVRNPNMNVELEIAPSIAFADGVAAHTDVIDVLNSIQTHLGAKVLPELLKFL
jgi:hypothetical protein